MNKDQIKATVEKVLEEIEYSKDNIYLGNGTLEDYNLLQITSVSGGNVDDINGVLKGRKYATIGKMNTYVNSAIVSLNNIRQGKATVSDYTNLNLIDINNRYIEIVNNIVAKKVRV